MDKIMNITINLLLISLFVFSTNSFSQVSKVSIEKTSNGFKLIKNDSPYYIKGAGAKVILRKCLKVVLIRLEFGVQIRVNY